MLRMVCRQPSRLLARQFNPSTTEIVEKSMTGTVEDDIKGLAASVKEPDEKLSKAQEQAALQFAKRGDIDPLLENMRKKMADDLLAMQEKMDATMVVLNRPRLETDSYSSKDAEFRNAHQFLSMMAVKQRRIEQGADLPSSEVNLEVYRHCKSALNKLFRKADDRRLTPDEIKALSVGSDPDGGYTVTPEMSNRIIERQFESSPIDR